MPKRKSIISPSFTENIILVILLAIILASKNVQYVTGGRRINREGPILEYNLVTRKNPLGIPL